MSVIAQPNIVTTGLVYCADSGNTRSYPGTGTSWFDVSGNRYNGTILNSPTFSSGIFTLNGTTQGVDNSPNVGTSVSNNFTYNIWCMPTATHEIDAESTIGTGGVSGQRYVIGAVQSGVNGGAGVSVGTNGVSVYEHGDGYMPALLVSQVTISNTVMSNIVIVYTNKQPSFYLNGTLQRTGLTSLKTSVFANTATIGYGPYGYFQGNLAVVMTYNISLTSNQILQNYNAMRSRYGI